MTRTNVGMLLAGATALLVALAMVRPAASATVPSPLTACPVVAGYTAVPDYAVNINVNTPVNFEDGFEEAKTACNNDPSCKQFDNAGEWFTSLEVTWKYSYGICTYMKTVCPPAPGFNSSLPKGVSWDTSDSSVSTKVAGATTNATVNAILAQAACAAASDCVAWNDAGWIAHGDSPAILKWTVSDVATVCTYVADPCPYKFGFAAYTDSTLNPGVGTDGVASGTLPTAADAEAFCKITPKCSAFSTSGDYTIGGIDSVARSPSGTGSCVYVKLPCPMLVNYTYYDGVANPHSADAAFKPSGYYPSLCFADMARLCSALTNCTVFDLLRYTWSYDTVFYNSYPGMCMYRKAEGFLPSSSSRRRALAEAAAEGSSEGQGVDVLQEGASASLSRVIQAFVHYTNPATHNI